MDILVAVGLRTLLYFLWCLPALPRLTHRRYLLAGAALAAAFSPYGLAVLWHALTRQPGVPTYYNYTGQALLLLVGGGSLALLGRAGWSRAELGWQRRFLPGTWAAVRRYLLPLLLLEAGVLAAVVPGRAITAEALAFHLLVPSVTEELLFRGALLAVLDRAFVGRRRVLGADMGWGAVVSSLVFGLAHGLEVTADLHVAVHLAPLAVPLAGGFVLAWCRARSGSLLLPIAVHGGMNELVQLIALLKG